MKKRKYKRNRRKETESKEIRDKANGVWKDPNLSCNKNKVTKRFAKPVPKVGNDIYLQGAMYLSHGMDDYEGGLARVTKVTKEMSGGEYSYFIETKEVPGHSWNWEFLAEEQEELKKEFKRKRAYPDPDDREEFNRWD